MEKVRVRGTHLPPEQSRRTQPGKGAAGLQTVVETVQLPPSLLFNPCTFISIPLFIHSGPYMARAGDMHTGVSYL